MKSKTLVTELMQLLDGRCGALSRGRDNVETNELICSLGLLNIAKHKICLDWFVHT